MQEAFEAIAGGIGRFVQSWFLPSLIAVALSVLLLFPAVDDRGVFADLADLGLVSKTATLMLIALVLAVVLASAATPLYRVLEGYQLPGRVVERKRSRHLARRKELRETVPVLVDQPIERGVTRERLDRYPRASKYVMPTRLGNALKAGESYGRTQYGLDTVLLWNQLVAVAPDELRNGLTRTRTMMDFYAGILWLSPMFAVTSVATAAYANSPIRYIGVSAILLCPLAYAAIVRAASLYSAVLRAVVDVSRTSLAEQLGLTLPDKLGSERALWEAVSDLLAWGHNWERSEEWAQIVDDARSSKIHAEAEEPAGSAKEPTIDHARSSDNSAQESAQPAENPTVGEGYSSQTDAT